MKKFLLPILLLMTFIPYYVNAETCDLNNGKKYSIDNLKIGQKFNTGDILYRTTSEDEFVNDPESISYIKGRLFKLSDYYAVHFDFENRGGGGTSLFGGVIIGYGNSSNCHSNICDEINCDKNIYWKLDRVEELSPGEAIYLYFKSYKRTININITNTVNNVDKYKAKKDELLMYNVKVNNTGDGYSQNNIITTIVPKGLEVDTHTISDNGIYDKDKNIITWNLDELGPNDDYTFNYYAKVVVENITEYIGNSYITSSQIQGKIESGDTIIIIENIINATDTIKNPKTGTGVSMIIMIIVLIVLLVSSYAYILLKRKKGYIMK